MTDPTHNGACLCGAVRFVVTGALKAPDACHCSQCRRVSGHVWASTDVPDNRLEVIGEDHVRWFQSSEKVKRGFCATCGSALFWKPILQSRTAVAMGAFDPPTDTHLAMHIFVGHKGDYYDIADGLPQEG
jgi:hypothetical protein